MKYMLKYFILGVFLVAAAGMYSCAPDAPKDDKTGKQTGDEENTPKEGETEVKLPASYTAPGVLPYYEQSDEFLKDKFLPIGWSQDGHFAYVRIPADEAIGAFVMDIVVMDATTNTVAWKWNFTGDGYEKQLPQVWAENQELFNQKLKKYKILPLEKAQIAGTQFSHKGQEYALKAKTQTEEDPMFGFEAVVRSEIIMEGPQGQEKIAVVDEKQSGTILGAKIQGHLKSPHQPLIVILYRNERAGYEGPPHVVSFRLFGAAL